MKKTVAILIVVGTFVLSYYGRVAFDTGGRVSSVAPEAGYQRIISLAPSITEVLYALDLGDRVEGVTQYCVYPEEAQSKPRIGAHYDTNYEAILNLDPDLIVLLPVSTDAQLRFDELGLNTLTADHRTLDGILESIGAIAAACQVPDRADRLLSDIHRRMDFVRAKTSGLDRPTILISAGRSKGTGKLEEVYAAGRGQWYDDVIDMAGGQNVFVEEGIPFPSVTGEALVRLNPDVIVEMAQESEGVSVESIIGDWSALPEISAVRNGRIYVIAKDYATIPGPRFVNVVEDLARLLHPEVDWGTP